MARDAGLSACDVRPHRHEASLEFSAELNPDGSWTKSRGIRFNDNGIEIAAIIEQVLREETEPQVVVPGQARVEIQHVGDVRFAEVPVPKTAVTEALAAYLVVVQTHKARLS